MRRRANLEQITRNEGIEYTQRRRATVIGTEEMLDAACSPNKYIVVRAVCSRLIIDTKRCNVCPDAGLWVGRTAHRLGRRPLLLFGFGALFVRGLLFAMTSEPRLLVAIQVLDGVSAAVFGVHVPLTIVDLTREHGHFNLAQGAIGCAMGLARRSAPH